MDIQPIPRWSEARVLRSLQTHRIASVVGARQIGKTTMILNADLPRAEFVSLDTQRELEQAAADARFFLRRHAKARPLVIDEVQKAPQLIGEMKYCVDRNADKGQFLITGSADFRKLPQANESLAGRVAFTRVRSFAEAEARGCPPAFLSSLFAGKLPFQSDFGDFSKERLFELVLKGGYPELLSVRDPAERSDWFRSYLSQQILLDIRDQWGVRKKDLLETLMQMTAIFSSKLLVKQAFSGQLAVSWKTLDSYLSALEASYMADLLPGWAMKDYDRPSATPKIFSADSGLMASLLGIFTPGDAIDDAMKSANEGGKLAETWVYNQLAPEVDLQPLWRMWHLRTKAHEIDFLIFDEKQRCIAIDAKSSESVNSGDFRHLHWFRELYGPDRVTGIVLYSGSELRSCGDGCYAVPVPALWAPEREWERI